MWNFGEIPTHTHSSATDVTDEVTKGAKARNEWYGEDSSSREILLASTSFVAMHAYETAAEAIRLIRA